MVLLRVKLTGFACAGVAPSTSIANAVLITAKSVIALWSDDLNNSFHSLVIFKER